MPLHHAAQARHTLLSLPLALACPSLPPARRQGAGYYCPFASKRAVNDRVLARSRAEAEGMVNDFIERTRK